MLIPMLLPATPGPLAAIDTVLGPPAVTTFHLALNSTVQPPPIPCAHFFSSALATTTDLPLSPTPKVPQYTFSPQFEFHAPSYHPPSGIHFFHFYSLRNILMWMVSYLHADPASSPCNQLAPTTTLSPYSINDCFLIYR